MSVYAVRKIRSALLAKGFQEASTHHFEYRLMVAGRKSPIFTRLSHGAREYDDRLLGLVAKEMRLRRRELDAFIECPLSYEAYLQLLVEKGVLSA